MKLLSMKLMVLAVLGISPLFAGAQQCCGGKQNNYSLTVNVDGVTSSSSGQVSGTPAPVQPGEGLTAEWTIEAVNGSGYGEQPGLVCQLGSATVFDHQEEPGGGSFIFYVPSTPGQYYFTCSLNQGGGVQTPLIYITVQ